MTAISAARHFVPDIEGIPVVLCADDYGLAPGVSRGIRDLIAAGRLSATSCMTISPFWKEHAHWLKPFKGTVQVGLHLTLTDQEPLGAMPKLASRGRLPTMGKLILMTHAGLVDREEVAAEVTRQFEAFVAAWGGPPDFIDGHQHAHLLPVVRDALLDLYRHRLTPFRPWLRCCHESGRTIIRRGVSTGRTLVISTLGRPMKGLLRQTGIPSNTGFRGVYDFSGKVPYADLFERFAEGAGPNTLIMCHPGEVDDTLRRLDPLTDQRETELRYFFSQRHLANLSHYRLRVGGLE